MKTRSRWQTWLMLALPPITLGVLILAFVAGTGVSPSDPGAEDAVRSALPYILAVNHPFLFAILMLVLRRNGETLRDIGWTTRGIGSSIIREVAVGALCSLGLYLFKELAVDSVRAVLAGRAPTFTTLFNFQPGSLDLPLAIAATTLVFVEESIYRGFALPPLRVHRGPVWAVLATSVAFGFLHWGNGLEAIVVTTVIGVLLAAIFLWRRNLVAGTVAHALYNLAILLT